MIISQYLLYSFLWLQVAEGFLCKIFCLIHSFEAGSRYLTEREGEKYRSQEKDKQPPGKQQNNRMVFSLS